MWDHVSIAARHKLIPDIGGQEIMSPCENDSAFVVLFAVWCASARGTVCGSWDFKSSGWPVAINTNPKSGWVRGERISIWWLLQILWGPGFAGHVCWGIVAYLWGPHPNGLCQGVVMYIWTKATLPSCMCERLPRPKTTWEWRWLTGWLSGHLASALIVHGQINASVFLPGYLL